MSSPDKLPLVQSSMKLLADQLRPQDRVAIVVYAGNAGVVLPSTEGNETIKIKDAIDRLQAGGSTAGARAYNWPIKLRRRDLLKMEITVLYFVQTETLTWGKAVTTN